MSDATTTPQAVNGQFLVPAGGQVKVAILRCCFSDW
jgi:hypothetical protein